jgi:Flp pilus assembly protein TadD
MAVGKAHYDEGDAGKAIESWSRAVEIEPAHPDAHLNLANAFLLADQSSNAIQHAQQVLRLDPQSAAAHYIIGCAHLRLGRYEEALRALQESQNIDVAVTAVNFQLGRAHQALGNWEDALREFQTAVEFEPDHTAAHYALSQVLRRTGRTNEAAQAFERYEAAQARGSPVGDAPAAYERCKHTEARMPFQLDPPSDPGIPVTFVDATAEAFGEAPEFSGPAAVIDIHHDGLNDLFVTVPDQGFVLLTNFNGSFQPQGSLLPGVTNTSYERMLVGDLQNNRYEDVIVLGTNASHVFQFATNGGVSEVTAFSGLDNLTARDAILADFDFTGTLDLLAISSDGTSLHQFRNLGNLYFVDASTNLTMTESSGPLKGMVVSEWNNDDLPDVFVTRESGAPLWLTQNRGASLAVTNLDLELPAAGHVALGDLNNDLHADMVLATTGRLECHFFGSEDPVHLPLEVLDQLGPLLLDDQSTGAELGVGVGLVLLADRLDRLGLDPGLGRVVDAAGKVTMSAGHGTWCQQARQTHGRAPFRRL